MLAIGFVGIVDGCVPAMRTGGAPHPAAVDSVWYISTRARVDGMDTRALADSLEYGVAVFRRAATGGTSPDAPLTLTDSGTMSASTFGDLLRQRVGTLVAPDDFALLYVHGFGTSLHEAWQYTAQAQQLSGSRAPWIAFCWPSNGRGISWPRAGELLLRAYHEDSASAQASRPAFARAATALVRVLDTNQVLLAAHSLGAQLVGESVAADSALRATLLRRPLRALAFLMPDVATARLHEVLLPAFSDIARRRVLYMSGNDRALAFVSRASGTPRAGRRSIPRLSHPMLETVDVTAGLTTEGWLQRAFGTHHAIHLKVGMLFDLSSVVGAGYGSSCREMLGTGARNDDGSWSLLRVPVPPRQALLACPPFTVEHRP